MLKKLLVAAAALVISAPALADKGHNRPHWKHWKPHHPARQVLVVPAPRAYYAPAPHVHYAPAPQVYYAPPAPVYYAPPTAVYRAPVPQSGVSIRLHFPL